MFKILDLNEDKKVTIDEFKQALPVLENGELYLRMLRENSKRLVEEMVALYFLNFANGLLNKAFIWKMLKLIQMN